MALRNRHGEARSAVAIQGALRAALDGHAPAGLAMTLGGCLGAALLLGACSPVIRVEAPDKPIEINLNVKVEQDVKVQVDRSLQKVVGKNPAQP
ncbi:YnbE family lipoprotein [Inquilinus limosus]|uniref:YnbE-like lipoprotein n=1 Tax=Inquilinus limosus TaxID=171674 RepID=A0A211YZ69_9PROT|nr:YnbE family lipoprotein [Inquilinus limosus]OWJ58299.1 hypothetical protein BWR60_33535 [Inquilinus limosus]